MPDWSQRLFLLLNAPAHPASWIAQANILLADSPLALVPLLLVGLWVWGARSRRGSLLAVAAAILVSQGVNQALGLLWFEPRPFMVPIGHTLMAHAPDNAFPSDHATFVWTLGAGLILTGAAMRWGAAVCVYGFTVAWSRVWLGVHFPDDMAASALVAVACGVLAIVDASGVATPFFTGAGSPLGVISSPHGLDFVPSTVAAVPEPASFALLGTGLLGLVMSSRRA